MTDDRTDTMPAPSAHGARAARMPTPPEWSYRTSGSPLLAASPPGGTQLPGLPQRVAPSTPGEGPLRPRPAGAPRLPGPIHTSPPSLGPSGRRRSPLMVIALSVATLGAFTLLWHDRINEEMSDFDSRMHVNAASSTLAVTIAWLLGLLTSLAGAARIVLAHLNVALPFNPHFSVTHAFYLLPGLAAVPYLVLALPFSVIAVVMTLERIRVVEDRVGVTSDVQLRPASYVWLLIVPIIGGLALIGAMQRRLNRVWELAAPRPSGIGTLRP